MNRNIIPSPHPIRCPELHRYHRVISVAELRVFRASLGIRCRSRAQVFPAPTSALSLLKNHHGERGFDVAILPISY